MNNAENKDKYEFIMKNSMEEVVLDKVKKSFKSNDNICKCEKCFYDVCAIALNALPPKYSTTKRGDVIARISQLDIYEDTQISIEVIRAIEIVENNPSHGEKED